MKPLFSETLSSETIEAFRQGTLTDSPGFPLTFATRFRQSEFALLDSLKVNLRHLLHSEQVYHYHQPIKAGDVVEIVTQVTEDKVKSGMRFVTLETQIQVGGENRITSESKMVIRQSGTKGGL